MISNRNSRSALQLLFLGSQVYVTILKGSRIQPLADLFYRNFRRSVFSGPVYTVTVLLHDAKCFAFPGLTIRQSDSQDSRWCSDFLALSRVYFPSTFFLSFPIQLSGWGRDGQGSISLVLRIRQFGSLRRSSWPRSSLTHFLSCRWKVHWKFTAVVSDSSGWEATVVCSLENPGFTVSLAWQPALSFTDRVAYRAVNVERRMALHYQIPRTVRLATPQAHTSTRPRR